MRGESSDEALFFFQYQLLELYHRLERMLIEEHTTHIHVTSILVLVAPEASRSKVFQGKAKGIDLVVAAGAIFTLAVHRQALTNGQFGQFFLVGFW